MHPCEINCLLLRNKQSRHYPIFRTVLILSSGFTLIEMMVVLAILAITLTMGVPAFKGLLASAHLTQMTRDFYGDIALAKNEAVHRNARVCICKSIDERSCTSGGGWERGWIIFHDQDASGTREVNEELIRSYSNFQPRVTVIGNGSVSQYVSFTAFGQAKMRSGALQAGTITICPLPGGGPEARQLIINFAGRIRIAKASASICQ